MTRSRLRRGKCAFSTLLFSHLPIILRSSIPSSFSAAGYDLSPSMTISTGLPRRLRVFLKKRKAADLSRLFVT